METAFARTAAPPERRDEAASAPPRPLLLSLSPATAANLARHDVLRKAARRSGVARRTVRRFFDTPDLACGELGLAVGVLEIGRRRRQIVRDLGDAFAERAPVGGDAPRAGERPEPRVVAAIAPPLQAVLADADLQEVFRIESRRTVWSLDLDGASCTLALDDGRIVAPNEAADFADAALILESGSPAALYRFVRELEATLPFTIEARTVERRGYALLRGEPAVAPRAAAADFPPDATVAGGFAAVLRVAARLVHDNLRAARAGDAEGVHQLRVALRRLRSILGVFAPALPEAERRVFAGLLKDAAHRLARARALDVFLGTTLAAMRRALPGDRKLRRLEAAARRARAAAYAALPAEIVPTPTLLALSAWTEGGVWRDDASEERRAALEAPLADFARGVLRRRHRRLKSRAGGEDEPAVETLHKLRLEAKRTRYAVEAFQPLFRAKAARRYLAALERLQDVLGAVNDASAAPAVAAALPGRATRAPALVAGWAACEIEHGRRAFAAAWRAVRRAEPFWRA